MLGIVHAGLASMTKTPELSLEESEAKTLALSLANVLDQFDVQPDPKVTAMIGLVTTAGMIYGPRLYLIRERVQKEKAERKGAKGSSVVTMTGQPLFSPEQPPNTGPMM